MQVVQRLTAALPKSKVTNLWGNSGRHEANVTCRAANIGYRVGSRPTANSAEIN
jgi:hypothetical protein